MTMKFSMLRTAKVAALMGLLAVTAGCTAVEGVASQPIQRKFQWFSFLEGGDFKASCAPGAPARYRMVLNAVYTEQVRIYELTPTALEARVVAPEDLSELSIKSLDGLLDPWRGKAARTVLSADDYTGLVADLEASGAFGPPNAGAELSSKGFYWTLASCHEGRYHFTGFQWPAPEWMAARFPERLFALDQTGVAVNPPRKTRVDAVMTRSESHPDQPPFEFHLRVGEDGLAQAAPLL